MMTNVKFKQTQEDHALFIKHSDIGGDTVLLVHVKTATDWSCFIEEKNQGKYALVGCATTDLRQQEPTARGIACG